ncbi:MAG: hypothetical protein U1E73_03710 [Planctomycetota bacterium]
MSTRLAACAAAALALGAPPDLLPPGRKPVQHELILDWAGAPPTQRFVASPARGFSGNREIRPGEPFRFSSSYGTRIYAVPADAVLPDRKERIAEDAPWPSAPVPVREVRSTSFGHPLARVITTIAVKALRPDALELAFVAERRCDAAGNELGSLDWLPLAALALAGAVWTWRLSRRAPPAGTSTETAP